jgi:hypothetical protein
LRALQASGRREILSTWTFDLRVGRVASGLVSEPRKVSFLSVVGKRRIHHAPEKKVLSLYNFPKATEVVIEVTSSHLESWI